MKSFPYDIRREAGRFAAHCPKAGLIAHGDTAAEAEARLKEALESHLRGGKKRRSAAVTRKRNPERPGPGPLPRSSRKLPF